MPIVTSKTKETSQSLQSFGQSPILDSLQLSRISGNTLSINEMPQILYLVDGKTTHALVEKQLVGSNGIKHLRNMFNMVLPALTIHKDSLKNAITNLRKYEWKIWFIRAWNKKEHLRGQKALLDT